MSGDENYDARKVFVVYHDHGTNYEESTVLGVYETQKAALDAIKERSLNDCEAYGDSVVVQDLLNSNKLNPDGPFEPSNEIEKYINNSIRPYQEASKDDQDKYGGWGITVLSAGILGEYSVWHLPVQRAKGSATKSASKARSAK